MGVQIVEEFRAQSVTGSGSLHGFGVQLPIQWPGDAGELRTMERRVLQMVAGMNVSLAGMTRHGGKSNHEQNAVFRMFAVSVADHWPFPIRPEAVTRLLQLLEQLPEGGEAQSNER